MPADPARAAPHSTALEISNEMSRLHRETVGRGPSQVRTVVGHDHIIVFLEDLLTPVERTLLDGGEQAAVRETRLAFQRAMREQFVALIEQASGRKVRAFLSQVHFEPDLSVEVFVLEPGAETAPEGVA